MKIEDGLSLTSISSPLPGRTGCPGTVAELGTQWWALNVNIVHLFFKYPRRDSGTAVISRSTFTKTFDRTNNVQSPDPI